MSKLPPGHGCSCCQGEPGSLLHRSKQFVCRGLQGVKGLLKWQGDEEFDAWSSKPPSGGNPDDAVHVLEQLIAFLEQGPQAAPAGGAHVVEGQHLGIPEVTPAFQGVGKTA